MIRPRIPNSDTARSTLRRACRKTPVLLSLRGTLLAEHAQSGRSMVRCGAEQPGRDDCARDEDGSDDVGRGDVQARRPSGAGNRLLACSLDEPRNLEGRARRPCHPALGSGDYRSCGAIFGTGRPTRCEGASGSGGLPAPICPVPLPTGCLVARKNLVGRAWFARRPVSTPISARGRRSRSDVPVHRVTAH